MTLRGSFSDLTLPEVLQLASLSGNSAVLSLRSPSGSAWIGIEAGAVTRVARDDGSLSAAKLLARAGFDGELGAPGASEVIREAAFDALVELFEWREGDFHLDATTDPQKDWPGPEGATLDPPVSAQALTLEAVRRVVLAETEEDDEEDESGPATRSRFRPCALIAIGPDLARLEELKSAAGDHIDPIHIFQLPEDGVRRTGQYLAQGRFPVVVLDACDNEWPGEGEWTDVAEHLRGMSTTIRIVALVDAEPDLCPWIDDVLHRPPDDAGLARIVAAPDEV